MPNPSKTRAVNDGPESPAAQSRYELYREAIKKVQAAIDAEFYLEAITLTESMIADRLESRVAAIHQQDPDHREFGNLGPLVRKLRSAERAENDACRSLYEQVDHWRSRRNQTLHQLVKHAENDTRTWEDKYLEAEETAKDGFELFRRLDREIAKHNRTDALDN